MLCVLKASALARDHLLQVAGWTAWHTAYLSAYAPEKSRDFPKLEKLTKPARKAAAAKDDWQGSLAKVKAWLGQG